MARWRNRGILAAIMTVTATMTACAPTTYWDKPGATAGEWEQTKADCMLDGATKVPAAPVYVMTPGSSSSAVSCDKKGRNCSTYDTYSPPTMQQMDGNAALRDQVIRGCLARNGWTERQKD